MKKNFPALLLAILAVLTVISRINAYDIQVWWTEFSSMAILVTILVLTYKKFRFSNTSYFILFLWCVLQIIGAHYTFERVPFGAVTSFFGFERNHYDRLAHFMVGCGGFAVCELVYRKKWVSSRGMSTFFGVIFIMALANFWELVEWIYAAVDGGSAGAAFLGSQGDIWDAQKDMLMDTLGALLSGGLFYAIAPTNRHVSPKKVLKFLKNYRLKLSIWTLIAL
ncbi:MAG: DUF2238 domain-containing protein, partial [Pseudomonadota bacterium]|nr:DUF2238 domain-containing protein [Pseudomonadota bacterium]